jgi:hypothetical protein
MVTNPACQTSGASVCVPNELQIALSVTSGDKLLLADIPVSGRRHNSLVSHALATETAKGVFI